MNFGIMYYILNALLLAKLDAYRIIFGIKKYKVECFQIYTFLINSPSKKFTNNLEKRKKKLDFKP